MSSPPSSMPYPCYPYPAYQEYMGGRSNSYDRDNMLLNTLQHQSIDKNITDNSAGIVREINTVDKHLIDGVCKVTDNISASTSIIRDNVNASTLGLRDAIDRNALNIGTNMSTSFQDNADRARDIQVSIERTSQVGTNATERNGSLLLQSIERNAGETRLASAVGDAATRQTSSDLARDIIGTVNKASSDSLYQLSRNDAEILTAVQTTGAAAALATATSGYEVRTLVNANASNSNSLINTASSGIQAAISSSTAGIQSAISSSNSGIQSSICNLGSQSSQQYSSLLIEQLKSKEHLAAQTSQQYSSIILEQQKSKELLSSQSSQQFAGILLEQQKSKEHIALQLSESKYEALKNKESLSAQMAMSSCDNKYEALKNTQAIQSQLAECCCEIKTRIDGVGSKVDDTLRTLDTQRLRDALNTANGEVNLLKVAEFSRARFDHNPYNHVPPATFKNYYSPNRECSPHRRRDSSPHRN
jgi:hypothetical protein